MKKYKPDKRGLVIITISLMLVAAGIILAVRYFVPLKIVNDIVKISVSAFALFISLVYFPIYFASLSYEANDKEIIRHGGIFIRTHQTVQFSSIQYTTVINTPLSGVTGLNFLIFFVYGGQINLLFLKKKDADEILKHTKNADILEVHNVS